MHLRFFFFFFTYIEKIVRNSGGSFEPPGLNVAPPVVIYVFHGEPMRGCILVEK